MATKVYGVSDDLVELEGDVDGEVACYGTDDRGHGVLVMFSDATVLEVKYGKNYDAVWEVKCLKKGTLFLRIDPCDGDGDTDQDSDVAHFADGLKWAYAAKEDWEMVR